MDTTTVQRAYLYRLYPNKGQADKLDWTLHRCRELYNAALEERREAYRMCGVSVGYYDQKRQLPDGTYRYGKNRARAGILVKRAHRHVANQRRDMQHKVARKIVTEYGAVAVEALTIDNMSKRPTPRPNGDGTYAPNGAAAKAGLNKSIQDAAWGQFMSILRCKAEEAGVVYVAVNPSGTSQHCSRCGTKTPKALRERWHTCAECGLSLQRDHNAALTILQRAGLALSVAGAGESHTL